MIRTRIPQQTQPMIRRLAGMALLAAGLLLPPALMPAARGADEPKPPTTRPESGERPSGGIMLDRLHSVVTGLDLTDEQKPKIEAEFDKARKALEEARTSPPAEGSREAVGKAMTDLRTGVVGILTEDQKKAMREKLGQGIGGTRGGAGRAGPLAAFRENMDKLGLSDEQKSKIDAILKDNQEKVTQALQDGQGDRQAIGEKIRPIIQEHRQKILDLLTDEQKAKLKELAPEQTRPGARGEAASTTKKTD
jgi:Spy/CpxP family protein refolding chaperone